MEFSTGYESKLHFVTKFSNMSVKITSQMFTRIPRRVVQQCEQAL